MSFDSVLRKDAVIEMIEKYIEATFGCPVIVIFECIGYKSWYLGVGIHGEFYSTEMHMVTEPHEILLKARDLARRHFKLMYK